MFEVDGDLETERQSGEKEIAVWRCGE